MLIVRAIIHDERSSVTGDDGPHEFVGVAKRVKGGGGGEAFSHGVVNSFRKDISYYGISEMIDPSL